MSNHKHKDLQHEIANQGNDKTVKNLLRAVKVADQAKQQINQPTPPTIQKNQLNKPK